MNNQQFTIDSFEKKELKNRHFKRYLFLLFSLISSFSLLIALNAILRFDNSVVHAQSSSLINPNNWQTTGTVVWSDGAALLQSGDATIYQVVTPEETGIYNLSYFCSRASGNGSGRVIYQMDAVTDTAVLGSSFETQCPSAGATFDQDYVLEIGKAYTVTFRRNSQGVYWVSNVSLLKTLGSEEIDIYTGLIENGDFMGSGGWTYQNGAQHDIDEGAEGLTTTLGMASISASGATIFQEFTPLETAVYKLSFFCSRKSGSATYGRLIYEFSTSDPNIQIASNSTSCSGAGEYHDDTYLFEAGRPYTITLTRNSQATYNVDNISITKLYDKTEIDIDTGLIENGDFISYSGWNIINEAYYKIDLGAWDFVTTTGVMFINGGSAEIYQVFTPTS